MSDFGLAVLVGSLALVGACTGDDGDDSTTTRPVLGSPDEPDAPSPSPSGNSTPTTTSDSTGEVTSTTAPDTTSEGSESSESSSGTTAAPPSGECGDGVLDPTEQCDDTFQFNSDSAACTADCKLAECGDGLLWQGVEQCDHGAQNNNTTYEGCSETCENGPGCGDGVLQPEEEECDPSAPPIEGEVTCEPDTCRFVARLAFVTTKVFQGDLDGLALADATCAEIAAEQGFDRASAFKAWLSDGVATPLERLKNAAADLETPYTRLDGQILADNLEDLITHGLHVPLDVTETGATLPADEYAWSNIGADGEPASPTNHCAEWSSTAVLKNGQVGQVSPVSEAELPMWQSQKRWSNHIARSCSAFAHLFCFED